MARLEPSLIFLRIYTYTRPVPQVLTVSAATSSNLKAYYTVSQNSRTSFIVTRCRSSVCKRRNSMPARSSKSSEVTRECAETEPPGEAVVSCVSSPTPADLLSGTSHTSCQMTMSLSSRRWRSGWEAVGRHYA